MPGDQIGISDDGFLKSNGLSNGIQSYGTVVDLLLAYYYDSQS